MIRNEPASSPSGKLTGLQVGRGIAAMAVVVTHAVAHPFAHGDKFIGAIGLSGVILFFVISGFIMVHTTGNGPFNPGIFMAHRLRRIAPLYWLACALLTLEVMIAPGQFKTTVLDPGHMLRSFLFIPSYAPRVPDAIFPFYKLGWTLNFEMFFYVVFALCAGMLARTRIGVIAILFGALALVGWFVSFEWAVPAFYTRGNILGFVIGMAIALLQIDKRPRLSSGTALTLTVVGLASLIACMIFVGADDWTPPIHLWAAASIGVLTIVLLGYLGRGERPLPRWMVYLGDASYSLYLFHMFAIGPVHAAFRIYWPGHLPLAMLTAGILGTATGLLAYRFIEYPIIKWLAREWPLRSPRLTQAPV